MLVDSEYNTEPINPEIIAKAKLYALAAGVLIAIVLLIYYSFIGGQQRVCENMGGQLVALEGQNIFNARCISYTGNLGMIDCCKCLGIDSDKPFYNYSGYIGD